MPVGDWIRQCNVRLWKYHEPPLSFVLTFYSLSEDEITDERVCALVRELQVNQSHQKLEWVQPFMSKVLRGTCWDCSVVPIPVHWNIREDLSAWWQCKPSPYIWHYIHAWMVIHISDLWSRSNESLLSVANSLSCMYQSIFSNKFLSYIYASWFLIHPCTLMLNSLTTIGYLLGVIIRLWMPFFGLYLHFCLEPALETWAQASLTLCLRVHDPNHTHSLASFQWSGPSDQRALQLTENCLQIQK